MGGSDSSGHDEPRTRRALDGVLTHMAQGVAFARMADDRLWLDEVNPAFARHSGYAVDELQGAGFERLVGPATDRGKLDRLLRRACSTECPIGGRLHLHGKDGVPFSVEISLVPLGEQRLLLFLRDAVGRTDELAAAGALAASLSDELMSPLAAALTHIELMEESLPRLIGRLEPAAPELVGELVRLDDHAVAARRAVEQVGEAVRSLQVLATARREDDEGEVRLTEVVDAAIRQARPQLGGRAHLVRSYQAVPPVRGDSARVQQIFVQLLLHLARVLPEGGAGDRQVRVSLSSAGGTTVVAITCTAPEVPPASLTEGLGRSISEALVAAHRGQLLVQLEARGVRFEVHLPGVEPALRRARVLIVDDDVHLVASLCQALGEEHEVEGAPSGSAALERLRLRGGWDVILCDVQMEGVSGIDVVTALERESPEMAERVVFMTGGVSDGGARDYLAQSTRECLGKPFELDQLRALVRRRMRAA